MLRWEAIEDKTVFGMTVKMYRDPFVASDTEISVLQNLELDHFAYRHFDSELLMYRFLDVNFEKYIEERGNLDRLGSIMVPLKQDKAGTIL